MLQSPAFRRTSCTQLSCSYFATYKAFLYFESSTQDRVFAVCSQMKYGIYMESIGLSSVVFMLTFKEPTYIQVLKGICGDT